jgi:hypothetical protein
MRSGNETSVLPVALIHRLKANAGEFRFSREAQRAAHQIAKRQSRACREAWRSHWDARRALAHDKRPSEAGLRSFCADF